jgi:hypothetical protein
MTTEKQMHRALAAGRVFGEWFHVDGDLDLTIAEAYQTVLEEQRAAREVARGTQAMSALTSLTTMPS